LARGHESRVIKNRKEKANGNGRIGFGGRGDDYSVQVGVTSKILAFPKILPRESSFQARFFNVLVLVAPLHSHWRGIVIDIN
jgi:hypothetical protein